MSQWKVLTIAGGVAVLFAGSAWMMTTNHARRTDLKSADCCVRQDQGAAQPMGHCTMAPQKLVETPAPVVQEQAKEGKYVGAETCKNCHKAKAKGEPYTKWKDSKHSKAYESLATDEAKKVAKEKGIDDPQKSEKCLKCHVTAFGVDAKQLGPKFDTKLGIQCEVCHGPGEKHVKARMAADDPESVTADELKKEINREVKEETCKNCHNSESPQYKEFKFDEFKKQIDHSNPQKKKK